MSHFRAGLYIVVARLFWALGTIFYVLSDKCGRLACDALRMSEAKR